MGLVDRFLLPPAEGFQPLLPLLMIFLLLLHLPFLGLLLVSSGLSLVARLRSLRLARLFIDLATRSSGAWIALGVIPPLCLIPLTGQFLYGAPVAVTVYLERILVLTLGAQLLLALYRRNLNPTLGVLGHLTLVGAAFFQTSLATLLARPEQWPLHRPPLPHVFSVQVVVQFGIFSLASILLTGGALLLVYLRWPERRLELEDPHRDAVKSWGLGLALAGAVGLPAHLVWDLGTAPAEALGRPAFALALAALPLLLAAAWLAGGGLLRHRPPAGGSLSVLALLVFGLILTKAQILQADANRDRRSLIVRASQEARAEWIARQSATYAKVEPDPDLGARVFSQRCSACHAWERRLVGPPYRSVLPEYREDPDALATFLRKPVKVNPEYPAMPNQGLTETEVISVGAYLLEELARIETTERESAP